MRVLIRGIVAQASPGEKRRELIFAIYAFLTMYVCILSSIIFSPPFINAHNHTANDEKEGRNESGDSGQKTWRKTSLINGQVMRSL